MIRTFDDIISLRPNLTREDFMPSPTATIVMIDNMDGKGLVISEWNHPTETKPTQEELDGVSE